MNKYKTTIFFSIPFLSYLRNSISIETLIRIVSIASLPHPGLPRSLSIQRLLLLLQFCYPTNFILDGLDQLLMAFLNISRLLGTVDEQTAANNHE
jgi:hypothetical protein